MESPFISGKSNGTGRNLLSHRTRLAYEKLGPILISALFSRY